VSIFTFSLSSSAFCIPRLHELLEAIFAMHMLIGVHFCIWLVLLESV
jgi:hypothetical protein